MTLLLFTFCSVLSKTKSNVKNILLALISVWVRQNNQTDICEGLLCYKTKIVRVFYRDVPDKMAASSKLSPQYYGVIVILKASKNFKTFNSSHL